MEIAAKNNIRVIIKEEYWQRERILKTLEEAHILVNSIGTGYNLTAVEAMGRGCVVLNSHPRWFAEHVPEAPVIHITKESLERTISDLLSDRELMVHKAMRSIDYYNKYHSAGAVGTYYKRVLNLK